MPASISSSTGRRILVLTPRFPYPIEAGDTLRIYHICRILAEKHSLTLLSLCQSQQEMEAVPGEPVFDHIERVYLPRWRSLARVAFALFTGDPLQLAYYRSREFARRVNALAPHHDLVLSHLCRTGQYVENRTDVPTMLEMTDALSLNYRRVQEAEHQWGVKQLIYRIEAPRMEAYEKRVLQSFDLVSLVSPIDRQFLLNDEGTETEAAETEATDHVRIYTNGIDLSERPFREPGSDPVIVFIGNMRTVHNVMACRYFAENILPRVRAREPKARFRIVGAASSNVQSTFDALDGVTVTGWVDSIADATARAVCGMGVMQVAGGLQNKILEYMALGLPTVANTVGVEGIDVEAGRHVLIGEDPNEIAEHVVRLCRDEELRGRIARRARQFVEDNHRWSSALRPMAEDVDRLLDTAE